MTKVVTNREKLKSLRESSGYTITSISKNLGYKTPSAYWLIENGERKMNVDSLFKLAKLYNVSMADLVTEVSQ